MSDPNVRLALRVHDECNGSDVFGSDVCTLGTPRIHRGALRLTIYSVNHISYLESKKPSKKPRKEAAVLSSTFAKKAGRLAKSLSI